MSPDMCPDMICNMDADNTSFVSLDYKQDDIDKEFAYTKAMWDNTNNVLIKLRLINVNNRIFGYANGKINYKQSIKFWSRVRSKCKKELKRLRDRGITGKGNLCELSEQDYMTWANYHNQYLNAEDMMHQARFYRKDKYGTHKVLVTTEIV